MALGIPEYNPTLDREAMSFQRDLLGQLGANIQKNITTVIVKNQLQGFAQGLQNVDPASPSFGRDLTGLLTQYPLAAQTPIAAAAINQLGAEYKFNQQQKMVETAFGQRLGLLAAQDYTNKQNYGSKPVTRSALEEVALGRAPIETELPTEGPVVGSIPPSGGAPQIPPGSPNLFNDPSMEVPGLEQLGSVNAKLKEMGLPKDVAVSALRNAAGQVGEKPRPQARITNQDGTIWTQFSDGSLTPAVNPETGEQLRAPQRTTQTIDRDRASLYTTRNKLLQDYSKVRAEADGLQAAWAELNAAGNPQAGDAGVRQKDKAAQAIMLKQALE